MVISIIIFFIIFGILVISHEGGHFLIARANGIRVKEFTVGIGPQIFHVVKGGTVFSIRLLPFGGACIFDGMFEDEEDEEDTEDDGKKENAFSAAIGKMLSSAAEKGLIDEEKAAKDEEEFKAQGVPFPEARVWGRIATILAGPVFNFILAYLIALVITAFTPWNYPVISGFTDASAAEEAGLKEGDLIIKMDGNKITMAQEVRLLSQFSRGADISLTILRDGEKKDVKFTPAFDEEANRYYMGLYVGQVKEVKGSQIIPYAWYTVRYYFTWTYRSLGLLFTGRIGAESLSGPVGMVKMVDQTFEASRTFGISAVVLSMMELALLLSVNLGIMNLLPIPALDGGRLIFLFIEVVRGKPVPADKEGYVNLTGMLLLVALMIFVLFNDIAKFFA